MAERGSYDLGGGSTRPANASQAVDYLIQQGIRMGASDMHLGVTNQAGSTVPVCIVRFRVHGKLQVVRSDFIAPYFREVLSRLKVLAGINTAEVGTPQDGQITVNAPEGAVVLRLNTIPVPNGEESVIRIQRAQRTPTPDELGMTKEMRAKVQALIQQKSGLIVLNGPAGSGKTTTIYALLGALASPERKILTAEDPIELRIPNVSHTQVTKNTSFETLGRAFMRQDADVIFIGEVRDETSAEAAVQLAQTGHLVLTTVHSRDALGVVSRLEAFGLHPNFISGTLIASLAQRLVPRICPHCRVEAQLDPATAAMMNRVFPIPPGTRVFKTGPGCPQCVGGVIGRAPIYELFCVDSTISELIDRRASRSEILDVAIKRGMYSLAQEALIRVYNGLIDFESVRSYVAIADPAGAGQKTVASPLAAVPAPPAGHAPPAPPAGHAPPAPPAPPPPQAPPAPPTPVRPAA